MYDMINIFEAFLPHLLRYPNPSDPLNGEAAALMLRDPKGYDNKVRGKSSFAISNFYAPVYSPLSLAVPQFCFPKHESRGTSGCSHSGKTEYVQRYASKDAAEEAGAESEDDDDMSSVASFGEDDDEEPAGRLDQ